MLNPNERSADVTRMTTPPPTPRRRGLSPLWAIAAAVVAIAHFSHHDSNCVTNALGNKVCGQDAVAYCAMRFDSNIDASTRNDCADLRPNQ